MAQHDPRIDAYIAGSAVFAQPLLRHLRDVLHAACPELAETIKWGSPSFTYGGKILCSMAAFKHHASLSFWHGENVLGQAASKPVAGKSGGMGQFGKLTRLGDLPGEDELAASVKQAMALIDAGVTRTPARRVQPKPPLEMPDDLAVALANNAKARAIFEAFAPSHRREYVEWITQAKRADTRQRRLEQAVEWMAQGRSRNGKNMDC